MPMSEEALEEIFTYIPPADDDVIRYTIIREAAFDFAKVILQQTPASPDQTAAIRKIREAVMTANASIALKGRY